MGQGVLAGLQHRLGFVGVTLRFADDKRPVGPHKKGISHSATGINTEDFYWIR